MPLSDWFSIILGIPSSPVFYVFFSAYVSFKKTKLWPQINQNPASANESKKKPFSFWLKAILNLMIHSIYTIIFFIPCFFWFTPIAIKALIDKSSETTTEVIRTIESDDGLTPTSAFVDRQPFATYSELMNLIRLKMAEVNKKIDERAALELMMPIEYYTRDDYSKFEAMIQKIIRGLRKGEDDLELRHLLKRTTYVLDVKINPNSAGGAPFHRYDEQALLSFLIKEKKEKIRDRSESNIHPDNYLTGHTTLFELDTILDNYRVEEAKAEAEKTRTRTEVQRQETPLPSTLNSDDDDDDEFFTTRSEMPSESDEKEEGARSPSTQPPTPSKQPFPSGKC